MALDRAYGRRGDIAILGGQARRVFGQMLHQGAQILQVEQQQALLVCELERNVEDTLLDVVQFEKTRQQQRPHVRDRCADRMALLAEKIPEHHGEIVWHIGGA